MNTHLLGVLQVLKHCVLVPCNTLIDVRSSVGETFRLTGFAAEHTGEENISVRI
jgi:hypothetical protein